MHQLKPSPKQIEFLQNHLSQESDLLDALIESSLEVKELLRLQRSESRSAASHTEAPVSPKPASQQVERNEKVRKRLASMRDHFSQLSNPVLLSRQNLTQFLNSIKPGISLLEITRVVSEPEREALLNLRKTIKEKMNRFRTISVSNQTVLIYTLAFYQQLLHGGVQAPDYDAKGKPQNGTQQTNYVQANC